MLTLAQLAIGYAIVTVVLLSTLSIVCQMPVSEDSDETVAEATSPREARVTLFFVFFWPIMLVYQVVMAVAEIISIDSLAEFAENIHILVRKAMKGE